MMFKPDCTAFAMIQPSALPGSYRHEDKTIDDIVKEVLEETQMIVDNGFDGVILQNMNDMPIKQIAAPEAIAYMTRIAYEIKHQYPQLILGVLVNWDGVASLAVADAVHADFVRVEHLFTGANVTSAGILEGQCVEIAALRKRIRSKVPVYADIQEVHGIPLGGKPIDDAAWEAVHEAFADGLFVSGKSKEESLEMIHTLRRWFHTHAIRICFKHRTSLEFAQWNCVTIHAFPQRFSVAHYKSIFIRIQDTFIAKRLQLFCVLE